MVRGGRIFIFAVKTMPCHRRIFAEGICAVPFLFDRIQVDRDQGVF